MVYAKALVAAAMLAGFASLASADTINFDDLSDAPIANGYHGLDWSNFWSFAPFSPDYDGSGYESALTSGTNVAYNSYGTPASISSAADFDLNSFVAAAAWNDGLSVLISGYNNGVQIYSTVVSLVTGSASAVTLNWIGVDDVSFVSYGGTNPGLNGSGTHFALDDLTISVAPVPLPAALPLFGFALAGMGFVARRRRTKL